MVITSAESADVIRKEMTTLFPESSFYGNGYPMNIMIDDSSAEREVLQHGQAQLFMYIPLSPKYVVMAFMQ